MVLAEGGEASGLGRRSPRRAATGDRLLGRGAAAREAGRERLLPARLEAEALAPNEEILVHRDSAVPRRVALRAGFEDTGELACARAYDARGRPLMIVYLWEA